MAVAENAGAKIGSSGQNLEDTVVYSESNAVNDPDQSKTRIDSVIPPKTTKEGNFQEEEATTAINGNGYGNTQTQIVFNEKNHSLSKTAGLNGFRDVENEVNGEIFKNDMNDLVEILSKLNPMAEEFVPPSLANYQHHNNNLNDKNDQNQDQGSPFWKKGFGYSTDNFGYHNDSGNPNGHTNGRVSTFFLLLAKFSIL